MCPNCLSTIAMAPSLLLGASLGGAGSAILLTATGLRFRTVRTPTLSQANTEETAS
jgi:hypothetical protein